MANQVRKVPFRHPQVGTFFQAQPKLENPYLGDGLLQRLLRRLVPDDEAYNEMHHDLAKFGERILTEIDSLGEECEKSPPQLIQYDPWGNRIDDIVTCGAWKKLKDISAEEKLIALGYNSKHGQTYGRLHQFAKLFMFGPASGLFSCPLAMTDGAAKSIKALKADSLKFAYENLTSTDPSQFWTSGQWMTERRGGSDVGTGTETVAIPTGEEGKFKLHGYKWFSSATDSDMALTLARIVDSDGVALPGSSGLSMFFLKTRKPTGTLNNIQVMKLKNKLGTRQLPTGELLLDGAEAQLVSTQGRGVASISQMLTITRIHNGAASTSYMRRISSLARDYSKRRICFGVPIFKYPLHVDTLAALELNTRACTTLLFEVVRLLGHTEEESQKAEEQLLLRLLSPVMKLYTGKLCVPTVSEGIECIGGQGYIEDTGIPKILRDAQVTPIWEGTTNILSLDVLRAIGKSKGEVLRVWESNVSTRLKNSVSSKPQLAPVAKKISEELVQLLDLLQNKMVHERSARLLAFSLAEITIGMLLIEQAGGATAAKSDVIAAERWASQIPSVKQRFGALEEEKIAEKDSSELVFDSYSEI
ncbi:unnamed protein product [Orchesella dallaii]|uniref:Acyl-CoA dehydrogenase AidB n=1 Tax=Orchesella dallaii TaxID=48710 RepID=A0ABP1PZI5_9HEXA